MAAHFHQGSALFDNHNYSPRALDREYHPLHQSQMRAGFSHLPPRLEMLFNSTVRFVKLNCISFSSIFHCQQQFKNQFESTETA